jgi:hypothetical protein
MKKALAFWAVLFISLTAEFCKPGSSPLSPTGGSEITANGLIMTVSTTGQGTGVLTFLIELKNEGTSTVKLDFSSSQTFDIEVSNIFSRPIWRWSYDKAFAMVVWTLELKPGEVFSQQADWDLKATDGSPLRPGTYRVKVWITNNYRDPDLSVEFSVVI